LFPEYADGSEGDYLERICAADESLALTDQKNIIVAPGQSPVEFCDLFTKDLSIIHVKRYGQSTVLSHLFAQGLISGELFQMEEDFRQKVNDLLPETHKVADERRRPKLNEFQIVYAIVVIVTVLFSFRFSQN
jgi:uncharacterized protein (TIGR04141 family)